LGAHDCVGVAICVGSGMVFGYTLRTIGILGVCVWLKRNDCWWEVK
jgi:hypothetical protein